MSFKQDLKNIMILYPEVMVESSDEYVKLINIHNIVKSSFNDNFSKEIVISAFDASKDLEFKNKNDYYYLVFKTASRNVPFKKVAYPSMTNDSRHQSEFDINKWSNLVHKIYETVNSKKASLSDAIDYYADTLDKDSEEDKNFKEWINYYIKGEHLKYSSINKTAFQFPLSAPGFYGGDNAVIPERKETVKTDRKSEYVEWRNKLYSAIRRIDKLLRQSEDLVDTDSQRDLADLLHHFDQEIRGLKFQSTASDVAFKYADKFKKLGFADGYNELVKYAQQAEAESAQVDAIPEAPVAAPEQGVVDETLPLNPEAPPEKPAGNAIERSLDASSQDEHDSGAKVGEYELLAGKVTITDAVNKLEEIAGRLSDRRSIRLLAEFDIILDKLGVAPMFPELSEAQSKLIDGYSYALTRVTKMLGMLSSGKTLIEISNAKKREVSDKAMREVNKTLEPEPQESEESRGAPAIQKGLEEPVPAAEPTPAPSPEAKPTEAPPQV